MGARGKAHLAKAVRWSKAGAPDWAVMLAVGVGMAVPVLLADSPWDLPFALSASLGGLFVASAHTGGSVRAQLRALAAVLIPAGAAVGAAVLAAGHGWRTDAAMVVLAGAAAVIGGYSRPFALMTGRFIVFLFIALSFAESMAGRSGLPAWIAAGALATSVLALLLGGLARAGGWVAPPPPDIGAAATAAQKFRRWKGSLADLAGWQYAARLTPCLAVAAALRQIWPNHHLLWIALTVAILCERQLETLPVKATQRALGAVLGVAATGLLVSRALPGWALAAVIAPLAGLGPWLRSRNYLAYTATMTPLIILLLDAGRPVELGVLTDRLLATLIGAALVISANALVARLVTPKS